MTNRLGFILALGTTVFTLGVVGCSDTAQPVAPSAAAEGNPFQKVRTAPKGAERVPDSYIVVFKESVSDADQTVNEFSRSHGVSAGNVYHHALKGFSAKLNAHQLEKLAADSRVDYIEPDMIVTADAQTLPWGVNNVDADVSSTRAGDGYGSVPNVRVYVIDTGIQLNHPDLNVAGGVDYTGANGTGNDDNGHGTHVAGTIGAKDDYSGVVGVAPGARLYAVKVLGADGSGYTSNIIKGIDYVTSQKLANPSIPMVANMSLGGYAGTTYYSSMDNAVVRSINSGVFYAVAAGNSSANASLYSPAHVTQAVTVGSYGSTNAWASSYSNYGSVVDINAPGSSILSTYIGSQLATMSGTSMATPHVAGAAALYLSRYTTASPASVRNALVSSSTYHSTSRVSSVPYGTTNLALYVGGY
jgi:subtilisin family serine protease